MISNIEPCDQFSYLSAYIQFPASSQMIGKKIIQSEISTDAYRNAIEFEKKTHASNLEHRRTMDNNMIIMDHEVEKLRAELANEEKRARAAMAADTKPSNLTFLVIHLMCLIDTTEV